MSRTSFYTPTNPDAQQAAHAARNPMPMKLADLASAQRVQGMYASSAADRHTLASRKGSRSARKQAAIRDFS